MTLTTQQNLLKAAATDDAAWKKAVVFATYQPALYQKMESNLVVGKKSSYVDEISLDELDTYFPKAKRKAKLKTVKKPAAKKRATKKIKKIVKAPKKRVIRAKKTTPPKKAKKPATATVTPATTLSKDEDNSSSFTAWLKNTKKEKIKTNTIQVEKKDTLKSKIKKSTKANSLLVTEPIAEQLVRQGYTKQAIKMYKQLKSIIPAKSDAFDAIIKDLKERI